MYAQGATNLDSHDFADNCDPDNPAVIKFYLPEETVRVNKMLLSYEVGKFRAYSKAIMGGGAIALTNWFGEQGSVDFTNLLEPYKSFIQDDGIHDHYYYDSVGTGGTTRVTDSDGDHDHLIYDFQLTITLPDHTHEIEYGIYLGPEPSSVSIKVDGNTITGQTATSGSDIDIIPYLSKDADSKISRGWHQIEITPDDLGRIVANVVTQLFVQSRGGGDY